MANVLAALRQWSETAASNKPADTDVIGSGLADNLRTTQAVIKTYLAGQSSTVVPSAGVADLTTATGHWVPVSGNSTVTGFGTEVAGIEYIVNFTGAPPLIHNSTSFQLPGAATVQASAGDVCVAESLGSGNWKLWGYTPSAVPPYKPVLGTPIATTTGSTIDFTGIPSWVKKITVNFVGVSTNGTSGFLVQIGDSGGIETSGYSSTGIALASGSVGSLTTSTAGFIGSTNATAADTHRGAVELTLENANSNTWVATSSMSNSTLIYFASGSKSTTAVLDRVRVTSISADTFDAGEVNIQYE